jgi:type II secretory pathway pseudopilin PulG
MPPLDLNLVVFLAALVLVVVACTAALAVVAWMSVGAVERQAERTAARLQARYLEEYERLVGGGPARREEPSLGDDLPYEQGPEAEVERMAGIAAGGDPEAFQKTRKWNEHFHRVDQQFTFGFGPGGGAPVFAPPPHGIGEDG